MKINKNSLQARIRNVVSKRTIPSNIVLQTYFFDAFLRRVAKSKYSGNFVFKGGFYLSSNLGLDTRATVDIDFLLKNLNLERENIIAIFNEIIKVDVDDNVFFEIKEINNIRPDDQYGGFNVVLMGHLENVKNLVNIDVATGDPITPSAITYEYKCLFDDEKLFFASYNFETIIAEKLQTVLSKGIENSRSKDFYDLYIIYKIRFDEVDRYQLKKAFANTCTYRGTIFSKQSALRIIDAIKGDKRISDRWTIYSKKNFFANGIEFEETIKTIINLIDIIYS